MAEIKDGFFGFLVEVFDSWAEFLRLRIQPRTEEQPAPKDPFVSAPPDHWLEMTAGLSFTDWGPEEGEAQESSPTQGNTQGSRREGEEGKEGEAPFLPDLPRHAETGAGFESVRGSYPDISLGAVPPAIAPGPAARSSFIDKRIATPEEAEFVRRQIRPVEKAESKTSFLSFSGKRNEPETGAKFVPVQKSGERLPARFFEITPSAGTEGERSAPGLKAAERSDIARSGFVPPFVHVAANNESAIQRPAVVIPKADSETKGSFIGKGRKVQPVPAGFPKRNITADIPVVFSDPHTSVPVAATFNKADVSRPRASGPKVSEAGVSKPGISEGGEFVNSPSGSFPVRPADFPKAVSPEVGVGENVFFRAPARKEIASVFPPGKNAGTLAGTLDETSGNNSLVPPSKWADLPELDLNNSTGAPGAENLRRRHLTQLDREQKGEGWSV